MSEVSGPWTTAEVVRLAGVTSRTLRHYDAIGLVRPVATGPGGVRLYGETELLRLQQVLVLRELGLGLDQIATALDGDGGDGVVTADLLRRHRDRLRAEGERLARLVETVGRTLERMEGGGAMDPAELFDGFDPRKQEAYEQELVDRYGDAVRDDIETSRRRVGRISKEDAAAVQRRYAELDERMAALLAEGAAPDDARVQEVLVEHYATVAMFWTPDREQYAGLGELYADHPDFRARYDAVRPGLAEYYRDAMRVYADTRLA